MPKPTTRARLLSAARELIVSGDGRPPSAGAVARRAGVSRLTVYDHFGSHAGLLAAVAAARPAPAIDPRAGLRAAIVAACEHWAADPALFRRLSPAGQASPIPAREVALALAETDGLRPGCSVREAEDVIAIVTSFAAFDRLHHDGRRATAAVADVLLRMAGAILAHPPA